VASLALRWERTLLTSDLMSSIEPAWVSTSPGYAMFVSSNGDLSAVGIVSFSGWTLQTTL
jgi:hypothetical protein